MRKKPGNIRGGFLVFGIPTFTKWKAAPGFGDCIPTKGVAGKFTRTDLNKNKPVQEEM